MSTNGKITPQHRGSTAQVQKPTEKPSTIKAVPETAPTWQEEDFVLALAHLEQLQYVISSLRLTVPQLVRSLTRKHESPEALYHDFSNEVLGSNRRLAELKQMWEGPEMRGIRSHVDASISEMGLSIDGVKQELRAGVVEEVTGIKRRGWREDAEDLRSTKRKREGEGGDGHVLNSDEVDGIIKDFTAKHKQDQPSLSSTYDSVTNQVKTMYRSTDGFPLELLVNLSTVDGHPNYDVEVKVPGNATNGERKLLEAIQRCLSPANRQRPADLAHTLTIVGHYGNLKEARCDVCSRIVDGSGLFPAARRTKRSRTESGSEDVWIALHESCLPLGTAG